jgi:hypothetical protein
MPWYTTPWSDILLKKLIVVKLINKFLAFVDLKVQRDGGKPWKTSVSLTRHLPNTNQMCHGWRQLAQWCDVDVASNMKAVL